MKEAKPIDFRDQISANKWKSFSLMIVVVFVITFFGYLISYLFPPEYFFFVMIIAIVFSLGYTWFSYYFSDKISIASVGAVPATHTEFPDFHRLIDGLVVASGLPKPKLFVMRSPQINAFASGRDPKHAVVCVTTGALEKLDRRELEGVLAHELGHIGNYDIRYMTLVTVMVGMVAIIAEIFLRSLFLSDGEKDKSSAILIVIGLLFAILAPIFVQLVQLSISRKREYVADATAVQYTRNPQGLIRALEKIGSENKPEKHVSKAVAPLFFANPISSLFSTHPPLEKRIDALKRM